MRGKGARTKRKNQSNFHNAEGVINARTLANLAKEKRRAGETNGNKSAIHLDAPVTRNKKELTQRQRVAQRGVGAQTYKCRLRAKKFNHLKENVLIQNGRRSGLGSAFRTSQTGRGERPKKADDAESKGRHRRKKTDMVIRETRKMGFRKVQKINAMQETTSGILRRVLLTESRPATVPHSPRKTQKKNPSGCIDNF